MSGGFEPLPHAGHETSEADTHVEVHADVPSDAGSTPAASTIYLVLLEGLPDFGKSRCHHVATTREDSGSIEEPNCALDGCRTQVHVPVMFHSVADLAITPLADRS